MVFVMYRFGDGIYDRQILHRTMQDNCPYNNMRQFLCNYQFITKQSLLFKTNQFHERCSWPSADMIDTGTVRLNRLNYSQQLI